MKCRTGVTSSNPNRVCCVYLEIMHTGKSSSCLFCCSPTYRLNIKTYLGWQPGWVMENIEFKPAGLTSVPRCLRPRPCRRIFWRMSRRSFKTVQRLKRLKENFIMDTPPFRINYHHPPRWVKMRIN